MKCSLADLIRFLEDGEAQQIKFRPDLSLKAQAGGVVATHQLLAAFLKFQMAALVEFPETLGDEFANSDLTIAEFFPRIEALPQVEASHLSAFIEKKSLDLARIRLFADDAHSYPFTRDFDKITQVLRESKITFRDVTEDKNQMVMFTLACKNGKHTCLLRTNDEKKWFSLHIKGTFPIPPEKLINVAIFFSKLNATFLCGSFNLDPENGEFSYKYAFNSLNNNLSHDLIRMIIGLSFETFDSVLPDIIKQVSPPASTRLGEVKPN